MRILKIIKSLSVFVLLCAIVSCGSTPSDSNNEISAPSVKDNEFIETLSNYKISLLQTPKPVDYNKPFTSSFIVQVKKSNGTVAADYPITIEYPVSNENEKIEFGKLNVVTDQNGKIFFKPEKTDFSVNSTVKFYPTPVSNKKATVQAALDAGVKADFKIKSKLISSGAILFIWEYNEKDKPATNCYTILSELQTRGATAGNAPINQESYIGASNATLYSKNKAIVENNFGYLICGTVKYAKPMERSETEKNWTCSLVSEIYVIDMNNGKEVYRKSYTAEFKDAKYEKAVSEARKVLAKNIVDNLFNNL